LCYFIDEILKWKCKILQMALSVMTEDYYHSNKLKITK
jgi:hypothetical protein